MRERVVVTGLGAVSALGRAQEMASAVRSGISGIKPISTVPLGKLKVKIGAQSDIDPQTILPKDVLAQTDRVAQLAIIAAGDALQDAGVECSRENKQDIAVIIGTGAGGKMTDDECYLRFYGEGVTRVHPMSILKGMVSSAPSQISMFYGLTGHAYDISSACASATHAIGNAMMLIRSGMANRVVTGGTEAPFAYGLLKAWEAMRVMSSDACRPFSKDRSGLVLGEGAGILVLESLTHARQRGAHIYAELIGYGASADAGHITQPDPVGAAKAMQAAMQDGNIQPAQVDYINAHGTGTVLNDLSETRAIKLALKGSARQVKVSSTKSMIGHTLGASGGLEMIVTILAMNQGWVPPTANFTESDPECDLDYVSNVAVDMPIDIALSNSLAFGGLNAVLAVKAYRE